MCLDPKESIYHFHSVEILDCNIQNQCKYRKFALFKHNIIYYDKENRLMKHNIFVAIHRILNIQAYFFYNLHFAPFQHSFPYLH